MGWQENVTLKISRTILTLTFSQHLCYITSGTRRSQWSEGRGVARGVANITSELGSLCLALLKDNYIF